MVGRRNRRIPTLEVDGSVRLTHHDQKDLGLIRLVKKRRNHFRILSDLGFSLQKRTLSFLLKDVNIVCPTTSSAIIFAVATFAIFVKRLQRFSARCTPSTILKCKGRETPFESCDSTLDNCILTAVVREFSAMQDWVCVLKCWNCTIWGVSIASNTCIIYLKNGSVQLNEKFYTMP